MNLSNTPTMQSHRHDADEPIDLPVEPDQGPVPAGAPADPQHEDNDDPVV